MYSKQVTSERQTVMTAQRPKFGTFIRDRRTAKGYSLRRFAELVGVSPTYLSHVEQGKVDSPPTADRIQKMAELLGESADELIAMAGRVPEDLPKIIQSQPEAMPALLRAVKGLTPEQIRRLQDQANKMRDEGGGA
jgi:transcriptional regulator with XRE-family HTH domain